MNRVIEKAEESKGAEVLKKQKNIVPTKELLSFLTKYGDAGSEIISLAEQERSDHRYWFSWKGQY